MGQEQSTQSNHQINKVHPFHVEPSFSLKNNEIIITYLTKQGYTLLKKLGNGSFGEVYKAYSYILKQYVAIKNLTCEESKKLGMFNKEVDNLSKFKGQQNVLNILDSYRDNEKGIYLIVTEFCDGTLEELIQKKVVFKNERQVYAITKQLLNGLDELKKQKVIHYDIKPENIFYSKVKKQFLIGDYGLSKQIKNLSHDPTLDSNPKGTYCYMSPEVYQQLPLIDFQTDVFSLGVTILLLISERNLQVHEIMKLKEESIDKAIPDILTQQNSTYKVFVNIILEEMLKINPSQRKIPMKLIQDLNMTFNNPEPHLDLDSFFGEQDEYLPLDQYQDDGSEQDPLKFYKLFLQSKKLSEMLNNNQVLKHIVTKKDLQNCAIIFGLFLLILMILSFAYKLNIGFSIMLIIQLFLFVIDSIFKFEYDQFNVIINLASFILEFWTILPASSDVNYDFGIITYAVFWGLRYVYHCFLFLKRYQNSNISKNLELHEVILMIHGIISLFNLIATSHSSNTNLKAFVFAQLTYYSLCLLGIAPSKFKQPLKGSYHRLIMQILQQFSCLFPMLAFSTELNIAIDFVLVFQLVLYEIIMNIVFWVFSCEDYLSKMEQYQMQESERASIELFTDFLPLMLPFVIQQSPDSVHGICVGMITIAAIKKIVYIILSLYYYRYKSSREKNNIIQYRIFTMVIYKLIAFILACIMLKQSKDQDFIIGKNYSIAFIVVTLVITILISLAIYFLKQNIKKMLQ